MQFTQIYNVVYNSQVIRCYRYQPVAKQAPASAINK